MLPLVLGQVRPLALPLALALPPAQAVPLPLVQLLRKQGKAGPPPSRPKPRASVTLGERLWLALGTLPFIVLIGYYSFEPN